MAPHEEMPKFKEEGQDSQEAREVCELPSKGGASTADVLFAKVPALVQGREVGGHGVAAEYERETSENPKSSHSEGMPAEQVERQDLIAKILAVGPALRASLLSSNQAILYTGALQPDGFPWHNVHGHSVPSWHRKYGSQNASTFAGSWGSKDTMARAWSTSDGSLLRVFEGHVSEVLALALGPDQTSLYTGSYDSNIREWDAGNGKCLQELR